MEKHAAMLQKASWSIEIKEWLYDELCKIRVIGTKILFSQSKLLTT